MIMPNTDMLSGMVISAGGIPFNAEMTPNTIPKIIVITFAAM